MAVQIQLRRGTAAQWIAANPVLAEGEIGYETDSRKKKIGNGSSNWVSLPYDSALSFNGSASITNGVDHGTISGLGLSFTPTKCTLTISRPAGGLSIIASLNSGTLTAAGFDFELSGITDNANYVLNYTLTE